MGKPAKKKVSVNVDAVRREAKKLASSSPSASAAPNPFAELAPGSVKRQSPLEQSLGSDKYREMIHDHNDKNKHVLDRLPFQFPKKKTVRSHLDVLLECPECQNSIWGTENTVGVVCRCCNKFVKPRNLEAESRGYNPDLVIGIRGTVTDKLREKERLARKKGQ